MSGRLGDADGALPAAPVEEEATFEATLRPERLVDYVGQEPVRESIAIAIEAARRRGDPVHQREEARFVLAVAGDPARALRLAAQNWTIQREPADARVLLEAAAKAGRPDAAAPALAWLAETGCEWPRLRDLAAALRRQP